MDLSSGAQVDIIFYWLFMVSLSLGTLQTQISTQKAFHCTFFAAMLLFF